MVGKEDLTRPRPEAWRIGVPHNKDSVIVYPHHNDSMNVDLQNNEDSLIVDSHNKGFRIVDSMSTLKESSLSRPNGLLFLFLF